MKCLPIFVLVFFVANNGTAQEYVAINNQLYEVAFNNTMTVAMPRFLTYQDNIGLIYANLNKFTINNNFAISPRMERIKVLPKVLRSYNDSKGFAIDVNSGDITCAYNYRNYQVITGKNFKTFLMAVDGEREVVYFLARPSKQQGDRGSLFVLDTKNVVLEEDDTITTQEVTELGNLITSLAVDQKTGSLALSIRTPSAWTLVVLRRSMQRRQISTTTTTTTEDNFVIPTTEATTTTRRRKPANVDLVKTTTTTPTTTTTTEAPKEDVDVRVGTDEDSDASEAIRTSLNRIKELYLNVTRNCEILERKTEVLFKRYVRTLELSASDEDQLRKLSLVSPIQKKKTDLSLDNLIDQITDELIKLFEKEYKN